MFGISLEYNVNDYLLQGVCISDCCNTMKIRSQVSSLTELWICIMIYLSLVDQAPAHEFINPSNAEKAVLCDQHLVLHMR
jgi:hypothetical protein